MKEKFQAIEKRVLLGIALFAACFLVMLGIRLYVNNPITGDEPHYLLMDYSLLHDRDLNLKNNYENNDARDFYPGLSPVQQVGPGQGTDASNRWYSIHGLGLPLVLLPSFAIAGKTGAIVTMVLISTATIWLTMAWVYQATKNRRLSYVAGLGLLGMYSYNGLAGYIYPDTLIAGLTLSALLIMERYYDQRVFRYVVGFILGFLLLIHFKTVVISGPLFLLLTYKLWHEKKQLPWDSLSVFILLVAYFFLSNHEWFAVWNPTKIYEALTFTSVSPIAIISAILFDSMRGLLVYNPVLLLLFVGLPIWFKRQRETCIMALCAAVPSIVVFGTFQGWQGGDSQIGRYAVDFLPVLMPAIAFAVSALKKRWQKLIVIVLFALTFFVSLDSALIRRSYVRHELRSPFFVQIQNHTGIEVDRLLPTFTENTTLAYRHGAANIVGGYAVIGGLLVYGWRLSKEQKSSKLTRTAQAKA